MVEKTESNAKNVAKRTLPLIAFILILAIGAILTMHFFSQERSSLVAYIAHDRGEEVEQLIHQFEQKHNANVMLVWDTEETEPVGTALRLANEPEPLADVYFGSEAMRTIFLKKQDKLASLDIPTDNMIYADRDKTWFGVVGEQIGIIHDPKQFTEEPGLQELFNNTACISDPYYGSTVNYMIWLRGSMGEENFTDFFNRLDDHARITASDFRSAQLVKQGVCDIGIAEIDDAKENDLAVSDKKVLTFPNTLSIVKKDNLHPKAPELVQFLLEHEQTLAEAEMSPVLKKDQTHLEQQVNWEQLYERHYHNYIDSIK